MQTFPSVLDYFSEGSTIKTSVINFVGRRVWEIHQRQRGGSFFLLQILK